MIRTLATCLVGPLVLVVAPTLAHADWESRELAGMSVEIYTPAAMSPIGSGRGLMIGLHGCTQTAVQLRDYAALEPTADELGIVIALPLVPNGGVVAGCWNYFGSIHTRTSGHNVNLIELTETLRDEVALAIDPAQIYLAGFSAGGGQAIVLGCLAPELYAGVGVAAGPSLGTNEIGTVATTAEEAAPRCEQLAGDHAVDFATQLAFAFTDTADHTVAQGYAQINADMFAMVYGGGLTTAELDMTDLPGVLPMGMGTAYADADGERIALMISTSAVGHAWPAGSGTPGPLLSYVAGNGLDFAAYLAERFTAENRRADGEWQPGGDDSGSEGGDSDGGSAGEETGASASATETGAGDDGDESTGDGGDDGADGSASAGLDGSSTTDGHIDPSGCQCTSDPLRAGGAGWMLLLARLVGRRRRDHIAKT